MEITTSINLNGKTEADALAILLLGAQSFGWKEQIPNPENLEEMIPNPETFIACFARCSMKYGLDCAKAEEIRQMKESVEIAKKDEISVIEQQVETKYSDINIH